MRTPAILTLSFLESQQENFGEMDLRVVYWLKKRGGAALKPVTGSASFKFLLCVSPAVWTHSKLLNRPHLGFVFPKMGRRSSVPVLLHGSCVSQNHIVSCKCLRKRIALSFSDGSFRTCKSFPHQVAKITSLGNQPYVPFWDPVACWKL